MARLTIDDLPEGSLAALRERAARHGLTPEREARLILEQALGTRRRVTAEDLQRKTRELFGDDKPENVVDEFLRDRRAMWGG